MIAAGDTVMVFTGKSPEAILADGGSQSWKLDPARARKAHYLICTQNAHNPEDYADGTAPHGSAFLIGEISAVTPSTEPHCPDRWKIEFSRYATLDLPNVWTGDRNPVRYIPIGTLPDIELEDLDWRKLERELGAIKSASAATQEGLTITQAKEGLAANYGVDVDSIEIVIRG